MTQTKVNIGFLALNIADTQNNYQFKIGFKQDGLCCVKMKQMYG